MILSLAFAVALSVAPEDSGFRSGPWHGACYREASLEGRDHELCVAGLFDDDVAAGAKLERSAEGIELEPWPGECKADFDPVFLPAAAFAGPDRAAVVTAFVQKQIDRELKTCKAKGTILKVKAEDMAAFLAISDNLRAGSFVPLDPMVRAPAAAKCGAALEAQWRAAIQANPIPEGGRVGLMMYTFSKPGPERAEARFKARPELMGSVFAMGTGSGGAMINARGPAAGWRDAPAEWFVTLCDVAIESWSSFVELSLYDTKDSASPAFAVRAGTGVAGPEGYAIWSGGGPK